MPNALAFSFLPSLAHAKDFGSLYHVGVRIVYEIQESGRDLASFLSIPSRLSALLPLLKVTTEQFSPLGEARGQNRRGRESGREGASLACCRSVGRAPPLLASYREAHQVGDLGWVDLDFDCCTELGSRGRGGAVDKMAEHRNPS